jgi:hypothetical protein
MALTVLLQFGDLFAQTKQNKKKKNKKKKKKKKKEKKKKKTIQRKSERRRCQWPHPRHHSIPFAGCGRRNTKRDAAENARESYMIAEISAFAVRNSFVHRSTRIHIAKHMQSANSAKSKHLQAVT